MKKEAMKSIVLKGSAPYSERIFADFCEDCKYRKDALAAYPSAPACFVSCNAVCVRFEFKSDKAREGYERNVLRNWATTAWLDKGKTLEEIYELSEDQLLSVLSKQHYSYFEKRRQEDKKNLEKMIKRAEEVDQEEQVSETRRRGRKKKKEEKEDQIPDKVKGKTHYFYCESKEGKKSTIKRSVDSPSYRVGVRSLRKSLLKQGIKIINEEVK